jgi:predicted nucleotidyltransferase
MIEISNRNKKLSPPDPLIDFFREGIHKSLGKHLITLILYGSRARGDAKDYSDYIDLEDYLYYPGKEIILIQ